MKWDKQSNTHNTSVQSLVITITPRSLCGTGGCAPISTEHCISFQKFSLLVLVIGQYWEFTGLYSGPCSIWPGFFFISLYFHQKGSQIRLVTLVEVFFSWSLTECFWTQPVQDWPFYEYCTVNLRLSHLHTYWRLVLQSTLSLCTYGARWDWIYLFLVLDILFVYWV